MSTQRGKGAIRLRIAQPKTQYETESDGKRPSIDIEFPENAANLDNNFFSRYLLLLYKVRKAGGELPIFVPQDVRMGLAIVEYRRGPMSMNSISAMSRWKRRPIRTGSSSG